MTESSTVAAAAPLCWTTGVDCFLADCPGLD
jgi:hypothetical protein